MLTPASPAAHPARHREPQSELSCTPAFGKLLYQPPAHTVFTYELDDDRALRSSNTIRGAGLPEVVVIPLTVKRVKRSRARDGLNNRAEFLATTYFAGFWESVQRHPYLRCRMNRWLINRAIEKMPPRPAPWSTLSPYTSWTSLTDRAYDARHLGPVCNARDDLPAVESVAALFRRPGATTECPKSTVLFAYFAQWFTDGFLRSDRPNPPEAMPDARKNDSTHDIDLCQIYGVRPEATDELRSHTLGQLRSQPINDEHYPPFLFADGNQCFKHISVAREWEIPADRKAKLFAIGSDTGNVQIGHVMMNVLFLREHNRIAAELHREYPTWGDERLFQTARNILIVLLIKIVIEEYINHIAPYRFRFFLGGPQGFQRAAWFRPNRMASEFNLLYRWHSLIPSQLMVGGAYRSITETSFNSELVIDHGLGRLFEEASTQPAGRVSMFNTDPLLVEKAEIPSIRKGRDVQLASYNDYREHCGFPRATAFNQISSDPRVVSGLRELYGTVDRIEFYPGLFAEDPRPNSVLPSLIGRMVGVDAFSQALTNPLLAPRVFNEQTFSPLGMRIIAATRTLSDILNRNVPGVGRHLVTMTRTDWRRA